MDERRLRRVFDQTRPSRAQREAMLVRLLESERKDFSMRRLKKLAILAVAAALMVVACAAAVVTGIDQRLLDYFGAGPEQAGLLEGGAVPADVTVEDNGAVLRVTQVLMDRYTILILADFTAPEGTVLDMDEAREGIARGFGGQEWSVPELLDRAGEPIDLAQSWSYRAEVLDDGEPLDNHLTLLLRMELGEEGIRPDWDIGGLSLPAKDLVRYSPEKRDFVTVYSGDWSCQIPVTWQDMGQSIRLDQVAGQVDGVNISVAELYLSPVTLQIRLERAVPIPLHSDEAAAGTYSRWISAINVNRITLTGRDGEEIPLEDGGGTADNQVQDNIYHLTQITSLEQLQGGTLTLRIGDGSYSILLNDLTQADEPLSEALK